MTNLENEKKHYKTEKQKIKIEIKMLRAEIKSLSRQRVDLDDTLAEMCEDGQ